MLSYIRLYSRPGAMAHIEAPGGASTLCGRRVQDPDPVCEVSEFDPPHSCETCQKRYREEYSDREDTDSPKQDETLSTSDP